MSQLEHIGEIEKGLWEAKQEIEATLPQRRGKTRELRPMIIGSFLRRFRWCLRKAALLASIGKAAPPFTRFDPCGFEMLDNPSTYLPGTVHI